MAKSNFFKRVAAYRKEHPRCSQQDAMKKLAGTKAKTAKRSEPRKRTAKAPELVARTVNVKVGKIGAIEQSKKIIQRIDKLEKERSALKSRELKDIYALTINAEHKKLKQIAAQIKSRA